jgi:L-seryl-tRNA(Ser) seleniumtransferase
MLALTPDALAARAAQLRAGLGDAARYASVIATTGYVGGGTLPQATIASAGIAIVPPDGHPDGLAARLRRARPAIVGRVADGAFILDLRTIPPTADAHVGAALAREL